jgi:inorganic pyrophosphatase
VRNDRLVAVPELDHHSSELQSIKDLPQERLDQLERFFVNHNREFKKRFEVLSIEGPKKAVRLARAAVRQG